MEIVNSKEIKKFVLIVSILIILFTIAPIAIYLLKFNGNISNSQSTWGAFGDYFGGIIGTLFNLIAVIFSLVSIYITLKIATRIHENEQKFNTENIQRESQKSINETLLIHKQNKPFPHVDINRSLDKTEIVISNQGPGTLIIKNWYVVHNDIEYKNYGDLLDKIFNKKLTFGHETSSRIIIATGAFKTLFDISEVDFNNKGQLTLSNETLINSFIKIEYEDIFENEFVLIENLRDQE